LCSVLANPGVVPRVQAEHNVRIPFGGDLLGL
jgi:hypothetical protein